MIAPLLPSRIAHWPLARLKPYARNARTHDADQVARIAASMAEFGWTMPCLVADDGELIADHGRVLAATQLGLSDAPVIVLGHLSEAQRRAYRIADNRLTELGELVFEPFCGSGTQLIASERTGRRCFAMELDPVYCDVAVRRWEMATGRDASRVIGEDEAETPGRRARKRA